jgi:hypothetical protein
MLLNKHQKELFKADYSKLNHPQLQIKYGASVKKINELALSLGLTKHFGRPLGSKNKNI